MTHTSLLSPFKETNAHGPTFTKPPPDIINKEEEWEVKMILRYRKQGQGYQYLVHFKGYPMSEDQYLLEKNLTNMKTLLNKYKWENGLLKAPEKSKKKRRT